jgi:hypothetical protein
MKIQFLDILLSFLYIPPIPEQIIIAQVGGKRKWKQNFLRS